MIFKVYTVGSVRTKHDITVRKVISCFFRHNERGHGLNEVGWMQVREDGLGDLFSFPYSLAHMIPEAR